MIDRRTGPARPAPGRERLGALVLALILSFVVWLSAISGSRPIEQVTLPRPDSEVRITVTFVDLAEGLAWYQPDQRSVKVTLRGIDERVAAMQPEDLVASVDLSDVEPQDTDFEGRVVARCREPLRCLRRGVRVVEVRPDRLSVMVGPRISRTLPIEIEIDGEPPPGYTLVRQLALPDQARVVGAAALVERVDHVSARAEGVTRLTRRSLFEDVALLAFDEYGRQLQDLMIDPRVVDVDLSAVQRDEPAYVFANPSGSPAEGYRVVGIEVEPERVQLSGPRELVDPLREGLTTSVDVSGITEDLVTVVPLDLPEGVQAIDLVDGVTVTVRVSPLQGTRSIDVPVELLGLRDGYEAQINPTRVRILLGGAQPVLDALDPEAIVARLDLTGLTTGSRRIAPALELPEGVREISVTPPEIDVTIVRPSAPLPQTPGAGSSATSAAP